MAKFCGSLYLVQVEDQSVPDDYNTIGTMKENGLSINNEQVDVTDKSAAKTRQLLSECGINSMSISGSGFFSDDEALEDVHAAVLTGAVLNFRLISDMGDQYLGPYQVASMDRTGPHNSAEEFSLSLVSAAKITHTPAP